ncbi:MAG: YdcH family protein [Alphaproteobacteria bacterium]
MQEFRIAELEARHARLEDLLAQEAGRPKPDDSLLADLKRQKLRIKDKMAEMQRGS